MKTGAEMARTRAMAKQAIMPPTPNAGKPPCLRHPWTPAPFRRGSGRKPDRMHLRKLLNNAQHKRTDKEPLIHLQDQT